MPAEYAVSIASKLLEDPSVNPTGLGARDSLRLEAGLCLYGHDLNEEINPIEGALGWTMGGPGSRRRTEKGFLAIAFFADRRAIDQPMLCCFPRSSCGPLATQKTPAGLRTFQTPSALH